jgi:hypothetical protein
MVDPDDLAVFLRGVRHALTLIDEELGQSRTGRQTRPSPEELREVQRDLGEIVDQPFGPRSFRAYPRWDGRAARVVNDWPEENPVRRDIMRLWRQYRRKIV